MLSLNNKGINITEKIREIYKHYAFTVFIDCKPVPFPADSVKAHARNHMSSGVKVVDIPMSVQTEFFDRCYRLLS